MINEWLDILSTLISQSMWSASLLALLAGVVTSRREFDMKTCDTCGLSSEDKNDLVRCYKYKTLSNSQEDKTSCIYYIEKIIEDGEVVPPMHHLYVWSKNYRSEK